MEQERLSFADCLKDAQRLGYAEADPTFDIEGHDTAQKLSILASLAFGTKVDPARDLCRRHLLDHAGRSRRRRRTRLSRQAARRRGEDRQGHRAARASDHGAQGFRDRAGDGRDQCGDHRRRRGITPITLVGPGAGGMATASAVVVRHRRHRARRAHARRSAAPPARLTASRKAPMQRHEGGYYIRLLARDKPGTAATIAKRLAAAGHFAGIDRAAPRAGRRPAATDKTAVRFRSS